MFNKIKNVIAKIYPNIIEKNYTPTQIRKILDDAIYTFNVHNYDIEYRVFDKSMQDNSNMKNLDEVFGTFGKITHAVLFDQRKIVFFIDVIKEVHDKTRLVSYKTFTRRIARNACRYVQQINFLQKHFDEAMIRHIILEDQCAGVYNGLMSRDALKYQYGCVQDFNKVFAKYFKSIDLAA